jgi:cellulose synthase/poly-beta-1,6-N-acetylglucosamine synthase-like glycosyltransferase/peptidoglycan/xylan/chitin deacetylase (PgdA/CDA1 family)/spore germination protein YaaH
VPAWDAALAHEVCSLRTIMTRKVASQVFFDPQQKRWRRFKITTQLLFVFLLLVFGVLLVTVSTDPTVPATALPSPKILSRFGPAARPVPPDRSLVQIDGPESALRGPSAAPLIPATSPGERIGFYVNWDRSSFASLRSNIARLDKLIPEWLHAIQADGKITIDDESAQTQALTYIREHRPALPIVALVDNFNDQADRWESAALGKMLASPQARARAIESLLRFVRSIQGAGICLNFEGLPLRAPNLRLFKSELYARFHPLGLEVTQKVPLDDSSVDYRALAEFTDYLILTAYDEHAGDKPGSLASQRWYGDALGRRFLELPSARYVIAIGSYGYDWKGRATPAAELSFQGAINAARESGALINFDPLVLNPTFEYYDDQAHFHRVWFLDAATAFNQLVHGQRYRPRGFALWRLGSEDPSIWTLFDPYARLDRAITPSLGTVLPGYDLDYEGKGEVLKVEAGPRTGTRRVDYNDRAGIIVDEGFDAYSSPYVIRRWGGGSPKKIALTFDDGPDPRYTPAILDVLRYYHVPATFFVIGANATSNAHLVRRIFREGHELGNHTFTHPNIATISEHQLALEISATERLLESTLGRRSILFRPPYAVDTTPETPEDLRPLRFVSRLGYYLVEMKIDPTDWQAPGVDEIVKVVLDKALNHEGNVVLLHDGGGDRSQTLNALPRIIEGLRTHGFELVSVSDLLGLDRDAIMPRVGPSAMAVARVNHVGFSLIHWLGNGIKALFLIGLVLGIPRPVCIGVLAFIQRRKRHRRWSEAAPSPPPTVSAVLPAYNEGKVICQTIQMLLRSTYPNFDIIVVDDGSTDGTGQRVVEAFDDARVRVFVRPNGGKGRALNYGISQTSAEIIVTLDADTMVRPDAITKLVRHFSDRRVGAVAGNVKVGNRGPLLARWQALEYITTQNLERRAFDILNCITVVPGAIGGWRRDVVLQAGGFAPETLAEDTDLTLAILRLGYKIDYEEEAVGLTEAPESARTLLKQRFRWMYGTLQAVWKHLDTLFRPRYGALGTVGVPYVLVFQVFFSLIAPVVDLFIVLTVAVLIWDRSQHPLAYSNAGLQRMLVYYLLFQVTEVLSSVAAFVLEPNEQRSLLAWVFVQRFFYRLLMYVVGIKTLLAAIKGRMVGWSKFERKATVRMET